MSDKTKHVTPDAPKTLSEKPYAPRDPRVEPSPIDFDYARLSEKRPVVTHGIPIERLTELASYSEPFILAKINELIDRINLMNEVK